jgi:cobalt/nickel transport system ATP-binding protein
MMENLMEIQNVSYTYHNGKAALKNINVAFREGERVAVVGNNGAGKSTFFLNLNGVLVPKTGKIFYRGQELNQKSRKQLRKKIGIVFQNADEQIIASTVKAEISFGPMNLKLPKEEVVRRVDLAMQYMGLTEFAERPPHYLSGGEKKRVSIADIIAMESELIIFDEPTAALDPYNCCMLEEVLGKLVSEGKTLLLSTHDMDFAYRFADRVLVFSDGELIADDRPEIIFQNDEILTRANLKKPQLLEIWQTLIGKYDFNTEKIPKTTEELKMLL